MKIVLFLLLFIEFLLAHVIEVNRVDSLLEHSKLYVGEKNLTVEQLNRLLKPYKKEHINLGVNHNHIWLRVDLKNEEDKRVDRILVISSPLLEEITLFSSDLKLLEQKGMMYQSSKHTTIPYIFELTFEPKTELHYYLRISSKHTPIDFSLLLKEKESFFSQDRKRQFFDILLIGAIVSMMLYSFLISLYLRDKSYFFYSLYLVALIYQQVTYLGITQIYAPLEFIAIEATLTIFKILFLIVTSALFAMHFLQSSRFSKINWFYKLTIWVLLIEALLLPIHEEYSLNIVIITGAIFIIGNLISGIYAYLKGVTEARLFIVGFGVVFFSYIMMIIDALGIASVMIYFPNILIGTTAIEALVLLLAFADRYLIVEKEKREAEEKVVHAFKEREKIVTQEVIKKTKELHRALEEKELLLQEVHHRVKNNLQIILSIIRLQADSLESHVLKEKFIVVENRINAIAKTYEILLSKNGFSTIDMSEYIDELVNDLLFAMGKENIKIDREVKLQLPIKEAIYIGLIINELLTNAFKYAFEKERGIIKIELYQEDETKVLKIADNGKGYNLDKVKKSLGLRLVETIVKNQLRGKMSIDSTLHTLFRVRF